MYSVGVQYASSHTYPSDVHGCFTHQEFRAKLLQRRLLGPPGDTLEIGHIFTN